jgi:hypothetical protein
VFCGVQLVQDIGGAAVVALATTVWLKLWTTLATAGIVDSKISRKLIHCGSGPLFMLCWPFFSHHPSARFIAACVPLLQVMHHPGGGGPRGPVTTSPLLPSQTTRDSPTVTCR